MMRVDTAMMVRRNIWFPLSLKYLYSQEFNKQICLTNKSVLLSKEGPQKEFLGINHLNLKSTFVYLKVSWSYTINSPGLGGLEFP